MQQVNREIEEVEEVEFKPRPRPTQDLAIQLPRTVVEMLERVAAERDMSVHELVKFYLGRALREDWQAFFPDVVSPAAQELLHRRRTSPD